MKFLTFRHKGDDRLGWLQDDDKTVLSTSPDSRDTPRSIVDLIRSGSYGKNQLLSAKDNLEKYDIQDIELLPPISTETIFCAAVNYYPTSEKNEAHKRGDYPVLFLRLARNHVAHNLPLWVPKHSKTLDWEGELAVIIGKGGRHIPAQNTMEHVFGYSIYNEGTVRGFSSHSSQVGMTKNFQASGSFGPCIVTADEFGNPYAHRITTTVDGEVMQDDSVDLMIHRIEDLIAYISSGTELQPGDVICTGTPAGIGASMDPPKYLEQGQTIEISIDGIGTLSNPVHDEPRD